MWRLYRYADATGAGKDVYQFVSSSFDISTVVWIGSIPCEVCMNWSLSSIGVGQSHWKV